MNYIYNPGTNAMCKHNRIPKKWFKQYLWLLAISDNIPIDILARW